MKTKVPALAGWNSCVFALERGNHSNLKNAMLYSDEVFWISSDLLEYPLTPEAFEELAENNWKSRILRELEAAGAGDLVLPFVEIKFIVESTDNEALKSKVVENIQQKVLHSRCSIGLPARLRSESLKREFSKNKWNAYEGAAHLQWALSRLLLPDVSSLPFEVLMELRELCKDSLNPMRAELLRLTDDLRKLVEDSKSPDAIREEAMNLVATRVEPVVREADYRTREFAEQKWRKLYTGAAKAFGFAGASLLDSKLIGKAIQQTLETSALALDKAEDKTQGPRMTAQFVLQAHSLIRERK
jgi:hypothetical protein